MRASGASQAHKCSGRGRRGGHGRGVWRLTWWTTLLPCFSCHSPLLRDSRKHPVCDWPADQLSRPQDKSAGREEGGADHQTHHVEVLVRLRRQLRHPGAPRTRAKPRPAPGICSQQATFSAPSLGAGRSVVGSGGAGRAAQSPRPGSRSTGDPAAPSASADGNAMVGRQRSSWEARAGLLLKQRA